MRPGRAGRDLLPYLPEVGEIVNRMTTSWCIVPGPTRAWAERVYPELDPDEAYEKLWRAVAHICRLDADEYVKYLDVRDGHIRLLSRNERHNAIDVADPDDFELIGIVVGRAGAPVS